jgi:hypothetical protein
VPFNHDRHGWTGGHANGADGAGNGRNTMGRRKNAITTTTTTEPTPDATPEVSVDATPVATVELLPPDAAVEPALESVPALAPEPAFPSVFDADAYRAAVTSATRDLPDGTTVPRFAPEVAAALLTSPAMAIAAGMVAVRDIARTADAIDASRAAFDAAASAIHPPATAGTINVGRFLGRKIMDGQNVMYAIASVVRVSDAAIAAAWRHEWPAAKCNFAVMNGHVTTTRSAVNRGAHGWTNGFGGSVDAVRVWGGPFREYTVDGTARR